MIRHTSVLYCIVFVSTICLGQAPSFKWAAGFGGTGIDGVTSMGRDGAGNVYVAGRFEGAPDLDPGSSVFTPQAFGSDDIFILKLNPNGGFVWAKSMGAPSTNEDQALSLAVDPAGNVYATGFFEGSADMDNGTGTTVLSTAGFSDVFVVKLNTDGDLLWARQFGGTQEDIGNGIALDDSGNVYVTGMFHTTVDFDPGAGSYPLTSSGGYNAFLCKLNSNGDFIFARAFLGTDNCYAQSIAVDQNRNMYITGYFSETIDFNPGAGAAPLSSIAQGDIFVVKLDDEGDYLWAISAGGADEDRGLSVTTDTGGNPILTGYFSQTVDFDPGNGVFNLTAGSDDDPEIFVLKLTTSGSLDWAKSFKGEGFNHGYDVTTDASDNIFTTGFFEGTADFDPGSATFNLTASSLNMFVSKLSPDGDFEWALTTGGNGLGQGTSVSADPDGSVFIAGSFSLVADFDPGPATHNLTASFGVSNNTDGFVLKLGSGSGNNNSAPVITPVVSAASVGGVVTIDLQNLVSDPDGNLDLASLTLITPESEEGATAEILSGYRLRLNYNGVPFYGTDYVTISVCDLESQCTQQQLTLEISGDVVVYNGVSPNGDHKNDAFIIANIELFEETRKNKVTILNRWGDVVFEVSDYNNDDRVFTGVSKSGKELPGGVYFYKIEFKSSREGKSGFLSLKR